VGGRDRTARDDNQRHDRDRAAGVGEWGLRRHRNSLRKTMTELALIAVAFAFLGWATGQVWQRWIR